MPALLRHIDEIARAKGRTVLFVSFEPSNGGSPLCRAPYNINHDFYTDPNRLSLIQWLNDHGIAWEPCGDIASENGFRSYHGNIYVDVPWDDLDPQFSAFQQLLENSDGSAKNPLVKIWACDLELAMKNAHHDEPGFWDRWAENF